MLIIKADTPDQCRSEIVKWLRMRASEERRDAMLARKAGTATKHLRHADAYANAADQIAQARITETLNASIDRDERDFKKFAKCSD